MYDITILHDIAFAISICMHMFIQLDVNWHRLFFGLFPLHYLQSITPNFYFSLFFPMYAQGFSILHFWHATRTYVSEIKIVTFARHAASRSVSGRDNPKLQHSTNFIPIIDNGSF